jgi:N-acetyl-anhydromuramyl-L-alanine amidase AmpD
VEKGRSLELNPAAQAGHNAWTIAICLHGLDKNAFTNEQFNALRKLCRQIRQAYQGQVTFHGHSEVSAKECPVFNYRVVLNLDEQGSMING